MTKYDFKPEKGSGVWHADDGTVESPTHRHSNGSLGYDRYPPGGDKEHVEFEGY